MFLKDTYLQDLVGKKLRTAAATALVAGIAFVSGHQIAFAEGTDVLEPPSFISIASGSKIIGAGVGLSQGQPNNIEIDIPAGVSIKQVLLYWDGDNRRYWDANDPNFVGVTPQIGTTTDTVNVNGTDIEGVFIGGRTYRTVQQQLAFRADITDFGFVSPGVGAPKETRHEKGMECCLIHST